ncbi:MAG: bifunctional demethylmenaquinone methyltransferase/2-methoxy-6-polyprenyl-1,4-benzoquinol methylase UbiE [Bdellovibrionales bacterium]|nr:bifunctional demethylmenaquinone methyltransferase/2-methoxy-6-polyprenyl-1,4-benzoquinol methylase UbiE [Bdellovibrionales bacterium]
MFDSIAGRYDCANDLLSFGIHRLWRRAAIRRAGISTGQTVVDLCSGTGDLAFAAARAVGPGGTVIGIDFVHRMLVLADRKRNASSFTRGVYFCQGDALQLPVPSNFADVVTVSFGIRNVDDPVAGVREMLRVVRPGGTIMVLEFGQPQAFGFGQAYHLYSRYVMPIVGKIVTGNRHAYEYLPETSRRFPAGDAFVSLCRDAGCIHVQDIPLLSGVAHIYLGRKPA